MTHEELERSALWNSLVNLGPYVKTKWKFSSNNVEQQLEQFKDNWCPYNVKKDQNNNRWGLPVTSHTGDIMDNYHLNSFGYMQRYHDIEMKEENFAIPTTVYHSILEIKFGRCAPENYVQLFSGNPIYPAAGYVYFANTQLDHSIFSFSDNLYCLVITVKLNERTHGLIMNNTIAE